MVYSNRNAFASLKIDGRVVTWGHSDYGGDSSGVTLDNVLFGILFGTAIIY